MTTDNETGALAGGPPSRMQVAEAIADVRARFDQIWPTAPDVLPTQVTTAQRWAVEHKFHWRARAEAEADVLTFAQGAALHDAEDIEATSFPSATSRAS